MSDTPQLARDAVYAALLRHANGLTVAIGLKRLAKELDISSTTVYSAIGRLGTLGWIKIIQPAYDKGSGVYRIVPEDCRESKATPLQYLVTPSWPLDATEELIGLWKEGHSAAEIGRRTGFTKNSIIGRARRLVEAGVIQARPNPVGKSGEPRPARVTTPKALLPPLKSDIGPVAIEPKPFKPQPFMPRGIMRPAFIDFRSSVPCPEPHPRFVADDGQPKYGPSLRPCQYPVVDGSAANPLGWVFCGVTRVSWPYCAEHARLSFVRVRRRDDDARDAA